MVTVQGWDNIFRQHAASIYGFVRQFVLSKKIFKVLHHTSYIMHHASIYGFVRQFVSSKKFYAFLFLFILGFAMVNKGQLTPPETIVAVVVFDIVVVVVVVVVAIVVFVCS